MSVDELLENIRCLEEHKKDGFLATVLAYMQYCQLKDRKVYPEHILKEFERVKGN